ncbi:MAG: UDP-N-acetylmuramoyl-L-alanyl-D-glutamate--2,6-diaminopimelate ligase [Lachnospiraceae bacterium]|nr:UDP-N-acetylmuramoyl-L-alanyl-D-glutamate--2,6-diaminopimelate ligase [Lachnospiraceae bacterium]
MKKINDLLNGLTYTCIQGDTKAEVSAVIYDSRKVTPGAMFICIVGANSDGHDYIPDVCSKGASCIIVSKDVTDIPSSVTVIKVEDTRYAMAFISAAWFDHPADKLTVIGITGTKGKTTTTYMVRSILEHAGKKCGLIGTIEIIIGDEHIHADNTTPESYLIQEYFSRMVKEGLDCVVMEVSSQGLMLHRTQGFIFDIGVFTNLEPDHIGPNEHKDLDDYIHCKSLLFKQCKHGIFNIDDEHCPSMLKDHTCDVLTYGINSPDANIKAGSIQLINKPGLLGVEFDVTGALNTHITLPTPGYFSVYNALCAVSVCHILGISDALMQAGFLNIKVKGRVEPIHISDDYTLLIDYAHNAMALKSLLTTLKAYEPGRLVCVFGCGGNRSKLRRFEMGEVSGNLADLTIITSDNPRFEEPQDIINDIKTGISKTSGKYIEIADRKEAIAYSIDHALPGDIIVLAGKGHEDYQEIKGVKHPMDERDLINDILKERRS